MTMDKPKGGRGKKAPYETTTLRVPIQMKADIEKLINDYRLFVLAGIEPDKNDILSFQDTIKAIKNINIPRTNKIDIVYKLVTSIYKVDIIKEELIELIK